MPRAVKGVLVECDPSIKAIILKIDGDNNNYIIEDLDDNTLLIKETMIPELKRRLELMLEDTQTFPEDEDSE
ncbi:RNA polymerase II transcription factor B subunit 5 [Peziza echinospora]|nr:RNA polymerase II transcription factor B subunit 5 [Peziza echinospora]